jgi:hypothetical protein
LQTGSLVRVEAIVTSLVFDHALRIRLKAQLPDITPTLDSEAQMADAALAAEESTEHVPTAGTTPEADNSTSGHRQSATDVSVASTSASTVVSSSNSSKKDANTKNDKRGAMEEPKVTGDNFLGRLNNLVTSDLQNITVGRDFLFVVVSAPVHMILGVSFLYVLLGWSSIVGLAIMVGGVTLAHTRCTLIAYAGSAYARPGLVCVSHAGSTEGEDGSRRSNFYY